MLVLLFLLISRLINQSGLRISHPKVPAALVTYDIYEIGLYITFIHNYVFAIDGQTAGPSSRKSQYSIFKKERNKNLKICQEYKIC